MIVADRDYITRFSSQLATAERLRVGNESGRQFQAIRTLQDEVRQYNASQRAVAVGGGGAAGREVRYAGKAAAPVATGDLAGRVAAPAVEESVAAKTRAEQERTGRDDALALTGAAPSPPAEGAPAAPELTAVHGEKAETPAAAQAVLPLQRPAPAKEPAGPALADGEQKAQEEQAASRAPAATQAPAGPASRALAERDEDATNGRFSYVVRLPANQDLLVIRVQRLPVDAAEILSREAAEDAAKPAVESGH